LLLVASLLSLAGCGKKHDEHAHDEHGEHGHSHDPRHGGVAVVLGNEEFHVEFTHGETTGVLQAYFLDGHMENYIRLAAPAFDASAEFGGAKVPVKFLAVANAASDEKIGDTSLFEAIVPGLAGRPVVTLTVPELTVKGSSYRDVNATIPAR
jgi:hypothetical protein